MTRVAQRTTETASAACSLEILSSSVLGQSVRVYAPSPPHQNSKRGALTPFPASPRWAHNSWPRTCLTKCPSIVAEVKTGYEGDRNIYGNRCPLRPMQIKVLRNRRCDCSGWMRHLEHEPSIQYPTGTMDGPMRESDVDCANRISYYILLHWPTHDIAVEASTSTHGRLLLTGAIVWTGKKPGTTDAGICGIIS
jgi:hypothetical protein